MIGWRALLLLARMRELRNTRAERSETGPESAEGQGAKRTTNAQKWENNRFPASLRPMQALTQTRWKEI